MLPALGVGVVTERGFFHFDRPAPEEPERWLGMARALPVAGSTSLILEAESSRGAYFEEARGGVTAIVRALAGGAAGTFHGVGPIEMRTRKTKARSRAGAAPLSPLLAHSPSSLPSTFATKRSPTLSAATSLRTRSFTSAPVPCRSAAASVERYASQTSALVIS